MRSISQKIKKNKKKQFTRHTILQKCHLIWIEGQTRSKAVDWKSPCLSHCLLERSQECSLLGNDEGAQHRCWTPWCSLSGLSTGRTPTSIFIQGQAVAYYKWNAANKPPWPYLTSHSSESISVQSAPRRMILVGEGIRQVQMRYRALIVFDMLEI